MGGVLEVSCVDLRRCDHSVCCRWVCVLEMEMSDVVKGMKAEKEIEVKMLEVERGAGVGVDRIVSTMGEALGLVDPVSLKMWEGASGAVLCEDLSRPEKICQLGI